MSEQDKYNRLIEALKAKAAEILPKGSRLALYGSRARGDARPDSDWDLHITIPGDENLPWSNWDIYAWPFELIGLTQNETVRARFIKIVKLTGGDRAADFGLQPKEHSELCD